MEVIDINIKNLDEINLIFKKLCKDNIQYLYIKEDKELHINNYIFRFTNDNKTIYDINFVFYCINNIKISNDVVVSYKEDKKSYLEDLKRYQKYIKHQLKNKKTSGNYLKKQLNPTRRIYKKNK